MLKNRTRPESCPSSYLGTFPWFPQPDKGPDSLTIRCPESQRWSVEEKEASDEVIIGPSPGAACDRCTRARAGPRGRILTRGYQRPPQITVFELERSGPGFA